MAKIKGNNDGANGRNDSYCVGSRPNVPREVLLVEVQDGKHTDYHVCKINGQSYVRSNPNISKNDNINK